LPPLHILIPFFAILLVSLSVHEAAHAWTADRLGDPTARTLGRVTLNPLAHIDWIGTVLFPLIALLSNFPLLGWAKPVPVNWRNLAAPRRDFAIVAAAGPISNLLLALLLALVLMALGGQGTGLSFTAGDYVAVAIRLNVMLAIFNMIPVPPLDGGNVLGGLLPAQLARGIYLLQPWGFLILYALLFSGFLSAVVFPIGDRIARWLGVL